MNMPIVEQSIESKLLEAKELVESDPDHALRLCNEVLNVEKDSQYAQQALFMAGYIMMEAERFGLAYHIYERCAQLNPNISHIYSNMGMTLEYLDPKHGNLCYRHAEKLDPKNFNAYGNQAMYELTYGDPRKCIRLCQKALSGDPDNRSAQHNMALAYLKIKDWRNGWKYYKKSIGSKQRPLIDYGVPEWNGEEGTVLVYGEQGVGDEILYASCIPDLMKTNKVIIDTSDRLQKLFERSFGCTVYGTRFSDQSDAVEGEFDYSISIGQLPYFYRQKNFPGTPYLKCDSERRLQWRSLFDTFKGRKIGLAWNGGLPTTGQDRRSLTIEDFDPLIGSDTLISLDYKEGADHLKCYPEVLKGRDIDDMAPLVAELDLVIACTTTVVHLAGALGVPTIVLVPYHAPWIFGEGNYEWSNCVEVVRQGEKETWAEVVQRAYQPALKVINA